MQNSPAESAHACADSDAKKKTYGSACREKSPKQIAFERDELVTAGTLYYSTLPTDVLEMQLSDWLRNCRSRGHTFKSREMENFIAEKLIWFLRKHEFAVCGYAEIEEFLAYARESHTEPLGRWEANLPHSFKPLSRASLRSYYAYLQIIFNWLKKRKAISISPMENVERPEYRKSQRIAYTVEQINLFIEATEETTHFRRDLALLLFAWDAGARAQEICNVTLGDLAGDENIVTLRGKGGKAPGNSNWYCNRRCH